MNPPYGSVGGDSIHLKFVEKCIEIINKHIVVVMPYTFVTKINHKSSGKFKKSLSPYLVSVQEEKSEQFIGTGMLNVAIYVFDKVKKENEEIKIIPINGDSYEVKSLLDMDEFSNYEKEFIKYLENNGTQDIVWAGGNDKRKKELEKIPVDQHKEFLKNKIIQGCKNLKNKFSNSNVAGLIVNQSNGGMNGKAFSSKNGQIYTSYKDFENFFIERNISNGYNVLIFNSKKAAENCKIALQNPLLRFTLYKLQDDQQMFIKVYKYIPAIDWEDDRVKTDEGLLEVCGCPKDKCKEYAEYCRKYMEELDNKKIKNKK